MNLSIILMATAMWLLLFLQGLHSVPDLGYAPWFFFGAGVAQWVAGVVFVDAMRELKAYLWWKGD